MFERRLVSLLAAIGGILVILGGIVGFFLRLSLGNYGYMYGGGYDAALLIYGMLAVIMGAIILVCSGYTHYRGVQANMGGGLALLVLGVVTWILVGGWTLISAGAFLTVVAGLVLMVEVLLSHPSNLTLNSPAQ